MHSKLTFSKSFVAGNVKGNCIVLEIQDPNDKIPRGKLPRKKSVRRTGHFILSKSCNKAISYIFVKIVVFGIEYPFKKVTRIKERM